MGLDPPRKSLCHAMFSHPPPPLLDVTARCSSSAARPAWGTAVSLILATHFCPRAPVARLPGGLPPGITGGWGKGGGGQPPWVLKKTTENPFSGLLAGPFEVTPQRAVPKRGEPPP